MTELEVAVFEMMKIIISFLGLILAALGFVSGLLYLFNLKPFFESQKKQEERLELLERDITQKLFDAEKFQSEFKKNLEEVNNSVENDRKYWEDRFESANLSLRADVLELEAELNEALGRFSRSINRTVRSLNLQVGTRSYIGYEHQLDKLKKLIDKSLEEERFPYYRANDHEDLKSLLGKIDGYEEVKKEILDKSLELIKK